MPLVATDGFSMGVEGIPSCLLFAAAPAVLDELGVLLTVDSVNELMRKEEQEMSTHTKWATSNA